ncbi:hypothetical protein HBI56_035910 [Parastagonospora nodorum]|uniref:Arrestin C-terminal-like domain-containing protein n=1 Tax=Phaeosphaeria nodorum (strain SN15 / ATCC MYA-4574 / FGSC 10173) TaxID=321614 RepID=A0A7U2EZF1_PHANO|nr:hypothetical protein HBH56_070890 [Parastagonospora nodorum]QRC93709.1 hypothetical protein JI435_039060 [Parastagonospora nodorum SN15]KAH3932582.1 hypothetical protein HBH54_077220 [Parastagonospora nodorum]KAH3954885.1 hypothetical protein HBH53_017140 [Parastagonospora nodorum]KAH3986198.1 hypothetical protein HBH52_048290 [Parastagonospora nodorum]
MSSSQTRATVHPPSPAPSRSFLSRLKSPLSSKSRNYTEFYIQSDDPHRQYAPGDIISGSVILKVTKPLRITHLVVSLHGYAQVFKNPNAPGDAYKNYCTTVGSGKGKRAGSYYGNGFVSLFEDEVVLCGEGRLSEGVYHFNFELEFPSKGLPSSIDFERGTIAYMLTATLTRPTTISPTASCDAKVNLIDAIDIAPIGEPKPRIISLEPISRRGRTKTPRKRPDTAAADSTSQTPQGLEPPRTAQGSDPNGTTEEAECPRSPSPSDVSYESQMSSGGASGTEYGVRSIHTATDGMTKSDGSRTPAKGKTITATIDVLKGGFLRGDQIPIKVTVNHTKHVRSLNGIVVTLYRQARVDMHPALPVAPNSKGDKKKTEDYYPKSRTGLGGLSLSSAGSSHLFRKDLSQSFAPLFVDPRTLTAEVKCAVRVPDEAFPTISNVPGAMISFKYYIEVVVDIQGKLTGLDRMVANAGLVNVPSGGASLGREDASSNMFSTYGGNFVDTDQIRREKGVISSLFEVIIGTKDSDRNGKRKQTRVPDVAELIHNISNEPNSEPIVAEGYHQEYYDYDENGQYYDYDYNYDPAYYEVPGYEQHSQRGESSYHAPPQVPDDDQGLSEKERMRRAEARLLPSQPPDVSSQSTSLLTNVQQSIPPSAPILPEDDDPNPHYAAAGPSSIPVHPPPPFRTTSSPSMYTHTNVVPPLHRRATGQPDDDNRTATTGSSTTINAIHSPVGTTSPNNKSSEYSKPLPPLPPQSPSSVSAPAPNYEPSSSSHVQPTDDKQEMQRRRLELEQSAPPDERDEEHEPLRQPSAPLASSRHNAVLVPSAPTLDDDDEGLIEAVQRGRSVPSAVDDRRRSEALPEYQR